MKLLHICMSQYSDGWTYQENLLSKYHKLMGFDVTILTSMYCYREGKIVRDDKDSFIDCNGNKVYRLNEKTKGFLGKIPVYDGFSKKLEEISPDIIFSHGCQYADIKAVRNYVKTHPETVLFVDNHADHSNSATNWLSKNILHKIIWKHYANLIEPHAKKFYGVLPARVDFLKNIYNIRDEKCELLVMGSDDELVEKAEAQEQLIREKYDIKPDDFLIVTGGKIDKAKMQTISLMQAVAKIDCPTVKLIVFGSIDDEIKDQVLYWVDGQKIMYAGWVNPEESYEYFAASDLVVFPGRHSVFWEQVAGQGKPMLCKRWVGTDHVDVGGNVRFLETGTTDEITEAIFELLDNSHLYNQMKETAQLKGRSVFSYRNIAQRSIELD